MKSIINLTKQIGFLTVALTLALVANFAYGQWVNPSASPPNQNVAAPINTSTAAQNKNGALSVNSLTTFGPSFIDSAAPTLKFTDTTPGHRDFWWHANGDVMYLLADRNDNGNWDGEYPWPLYLYAGGTPAEDAAVFSNQVRANAYCDRGGGNCIVPGQSGGGTCRTVDDWSSGPNHVAIASCAANETMRYGGGACTDILDRGRVNASHPSGNSWVFDCYGTSGGESAAWATAVCCIN